MPETHVHEPLRHLDEYDAGLRVIIGDRSQCWPQRTRRFTSAANGQRRTSQAMVSVMGTDGLIDGSSTSSPRKEIGGFDHGEDGEKRICVHGDMCCPLRRICAVEGDRESHLAEEGDI